MPQKGMQVDNKMVIDDIAVVNVTIEQSAVART